MLSHSNTKCGSISVTKLLSFELSKGCFGGFAPSPRRQTNNCIGIYNIQGKTAGVKKLIEWIISFQKNSMLSLITKQSFILLFYKKNTMLNFEN